MPTPPKARGRWAVAATVALLMGAGAGAGPVTQAKAALGATVGEAEPNDAPGVASFPPGPGVETDEMMAR